MALVIIVTSATIVGVAYYLAYRNPVEFNLSHAMAVLLLALMATGAGEYSREMLRKPYVIGRWMYSNGVRVPSVSHINQQGYLLHSAWTWSAGGAATSSSYSRGEAIFRGECGSCHTLSGYRPLKELLAGRDAANIASFVTMLHEYKPDSPYRRFMPPMAGTQQDIDDLTNFLNAQVNPPAAGKKPLLSAQK
jgi:mono/diheme cytochrome c family protein